MSEVAYPTHRTAQHTQPSNRPEPEAHKPYSLNPLASPLPQTRFSLSWPWRGCLDEAGSTLESRKHLPPGVVAYELVGELEEGDGSPLRGGRVDL